MRIFQSITCGYPKVNRPENPNHNKSTPPTPIARNRHVSTTHSAAPLLGKPSLPYCPDRSVNTTYNVVPRATCFVLLPTYNLSRANIKNLPPSFSSRAVHPLRRTMLSPRAIVCTSHEPHNKINQKWDEKYWISTHFSSHFNIFIQIYANYCLLIII